MGHYTVDNRGVTRPWGAEGSRIASLREELSWVAVPMGKCSEPTNVRAGGQACPIRYQCCWISAMFPWSRNTQCIVISLAGWVDRTSDYVVRILDIPSSIL